MARTLAPLVLALLAALALATPASARPPLCTTDQLRVRLHSDLSATGHTNVAFRLRNTGPSCRSRGFPGIGLNDWRGKRLAVQARRSTRDFFGRTPVRSMVIAHGGIASFRLDAATDGGCPTASSLDFTAPDRKRSRRVPIKGGFMACRGDVTVSPLLEGGRAYKA